MNIAEEILRGGDDRAAAVVHGRECLSYAELRARVNGLAAWLRAQGYARGERIGLLAENSFFFIAAYLGVIRAGLCVVPFPIDSTERTIARLLPTLRLRCLLASARFAACVEPIAGALGVPVHIEPADQTAVIGAADVDPPRDLAAIMLTSGSTGEPKGVMVSHRNIQCNTRDILAYTGIGAHDRVMVVLPFYYCYGASLLHTHLAAGGTLVLNNRFQFPEGVLDDMADKQCTGLAGVPSTFQILLRRTRFAERQFPSLRWLQQAGGRLPTVFIRKLRVAFPQVRLFVMYGQTEATARLSYMPPELLDAKVGSIGKGLPSTRLEVLRPDGTPVQPGSEEVGEIVAAGENVTLGYWGDAAESARFFRNGRLYTGDLARVDTDGFIFLVDRARDFIKPLGQRVSPKEIEEVLAAMPEVVEAAVVGVPDEQWGEAIEAFVVPAKPGQLTAADVRARCLAELPFFKVPQYLQFLPSLPKTSNGKIAREQLRAMAAERRAAAESPQQGTPA